MVTYCCSCKMACWRPTSCWLAKIGIKFCPGIELLLLKNRQLETKHETQRITITTTTTTMKQKHFFYRASKRVLNFSRFCLLYFLSKSRHLLFKITFLTLERLRIDLFFNFCFCPRLVSTKIRVS